METILPSKSRRKSVGQILGVTTEKRAKALLTDWANTRGEVAAWRNLFRLYPEIAVGSTVDDSGFLPNQAMAVQMQRYLRAAWKSPDVRQFDWSAWSALSFYFTELRLNATRTKSLSPTQLAAPDLLFMLEEHPPVIITPVEAALSFFRHNRARVLFCPNPTCSTPYFFQSKKGQKFCSPECAKPSQRESKRLWWANNKSEKKGRKAH